MRDIPVGNGSFLVTFDDKYQIRDVYFPHVGQENHSEGFPFRFGVWVDDKFSWIYKDDWKRELKYISETLVTDVKLTNETLGIEITSSDTVASRENVFLRHVHVKNLSEKPREIRIFLHQDFRISEQKVGDTAIYDPESVSLIHYKKNRYFLINTEPHFDSFSTGRKAFRDQEGTWRDAEDGELKGGAITEGSVDSTICVKLHIESKETGEFYYWICAGTSYDEVTKINQKIIDRTPERHFKYTSHYWRAWVNKNDIDFGDLMPEIIDLFKRSLLVVRTQIDADGAILAANDSDVTERATDHYSYLWTRDGAFIANALDLAGYPFLTRKFFDFCNRIVHKNGYFLQKYNADGTVASGWHAMWDVWERKKLTPIQEDETALVLWALWEHYNKERDIEFIRRIYRNLIVRCADFMNDFRHDWLNLPKPSWNLWEDRRGIHTFTVASVIAGLRAAVKFARLFGEDENAAKWKKTADEFTEGMREHLYSKELGRFLRSLQFNGDEHFEHDANIDASMFAVFYFGVLPTDDEMVIGTMKAIEENLWVKTKIGGVARFQDDGYMQISRETTGNPWFICTLWLADYYIASAKTKEDLGKALCILEWTTMRALPSGVLAEQVNPLNGEHASVSPLTWSHSTFVATVMNYLKKVKEFEK